MSQVERLLRPDDVYQASVWFFGFKPESDGPCPRRVTLAKWVYWKALKDIGLSRNEISALTGVKRSSLIHASKVGVPECYVAGVLERARELAE